MAPDKPSAPMSVKPGIVNQERTEAVRRRIFLVDDHPIVLRGLQLLVGLEPDLEVCGNADNAPAALEGIRRLLPDVAIVDLGLKDSSGLELIEQLVRECGAVKILVFSMHNESSYIDHAFKAGAHGYIMKEEGAETAIKAVRRLLEGKPFVSARLASRFPKPGSGVDI